MVNNLQVGKSYYWYLCGYTSATKVVCVEVETPDCCKVQSSSGEEWWSSRKGLYNSLEDANVECQRYLARLYQDGIAEFPTKESVLQFLLKAAEIEDEEFLAQESNVKLLFEKAELDCRDKYMFKRRIKDLFGIEI